MSGTNGAFFWNEKHPKTQARDIEFAFGITAAKTVAVNPVGADCLSFFDAITQAQIDAYLGAANDFAANLFDATAMGANTFGGIIRMSGAPSTAGQAASVIRMSAQCFSGTGNTTLVSRAASGTIAMVASTLETSVGISTLGNLAFKIDFGNTPTFDSLTAGLIVIRVSYISK